MSFKGFFVPLTGFDRHMSPASWAALLVWREGGGGGRWVSERDNGHLTPRAIPNYLCVSVLFTVSASHFHFVHVGRHACAHYFLFLCRKKIYKHARYFCKTNELDVKTPRPWLHFTVAEDMLAMMSYFVLFCSGCETDLLAFQAGSPLYGF